MHLKQTLRRFKWQPSGTIGVMALGHRRFVGGYWDQMGQLQLDFLRAQGLRPEHVLVDVACGSLRGGRLLIPYLEPGNYLGIEREAALVKAGLAKEVPALVVEEKRPQLLVDRRFNFDRLNRRPDFGIANSLFSHLNSADIMTCLRNLQVFAPECRFFATFRPFDGHPNPKRSTAHADFRYTPDELVRMAQRAGWTTTTYIGEWGHPTGQHMMQFGG